MANDATRMRSAGAKGLGIVRAALSRQMYWALAEGARPRACFWMIFSHCHQHLWQERHGGGSRAQQERNPFAMEHACGQNDRGAVSHLWLLLTQ
jgi:hypothetical protein